MIEQAQSFRGSHSIEPGMTAVNVGSTPRPLVPRDFHARLPTQMGMESPDNRPAVDEIVVG